MIAYCLLQILGFPQLLNLDLKNHPLPKHKIIHIYLCSYIFKCSFTVWIKGVNERGVLVKREFNILFLITNFLLTVCGRHVTAVYEEFFALLLIFWSLYYNLTERNNCGMSLGHLVQYNLGKTEILCDHYTCIFSFLYTT